MDRAGFGKTSTLRSSYTATPWNMCTFNNHGTSLWNSVPNYGLIKISPWLVDCCKCCQLGSTDDRRHFITLSVHLCVQPDRKGKERKSIYIAPFRTKVHPKCSGMDHTVLPANNTMPAFDTAGRADSSATDETRLYEQQKEHTQRGDKFTAKWLLVLCVFATSISNLHKSASLSFTPHRIITRTLTTNIPTKRNTNVSMNGNVTVMQSTRQLLV